MTLMSCIQAWFAVGEEECKSCTLSTFKLIAIVGIDLYKWPKGRYGNCYI